MHVELHCFVEDREAETMLRELISRHDEAAAILPRIGISAVGASNVVTMLGKLSVDKKLPYKSIAFLDGDSMPSQGCTLLPGTEAPEKVVFKALKEKNWAQLSDRFGLGAGGLYADLDDVLLNPEHHQWTTLIGDKTRKSRHHVWETMTSEWSKLCLGKPEVDRVVNAIKAAL